MGNISSSSIPIFRVVFPNDAILFLLAIVHLKLLFRSIGKLSSFLNLNYCGYYFFQENGENCRLCSKKIATVWTACKKQPISVCTIRRNLKKVGFHACIPRHKPAMTEAHRQAHLEWAFAHRNWTTRSGEDPSRMVWGCFSWYWLGPIVSLKGSVTGQTHTKIIQDYVVPTLDEHFPHGNGIFQDNAPSHRSKVAMAAREDAKIVVLQWSAQNPDLNPIENMWAEMKAMVRHHDSPPSNMRSMLKMCGMIFLQNITKN
ncbi:IS630 family transposase [Rhizophagus clarus]|uniref:IS630 family transposase n=1 Tax=Rhizophagus clarus TaxID=94130 RepID=A0A8H3KZ21_9GLOM|nr:IS630 family transposase [Rhizophagus clarus]